MKPPSRLCGRCGTAHWGNCDNPPVSIDQLREIAKSPALSRKDPEKKIIMPEPAGIERVAFRQELDAMADNEARMEGYRRRRPDLVAKLRNTECGGKDEDGMLFALLQEAADEIEELRTKLGNKRASRAGYMKVYRKGGKAK